MANTTNLPNDLSQMGVEISRLRLEVDAIRAALKKIGVEALVNPGALLASRGSSDHVSRAIRAGSDPARLAQHDAALAYQKAASAKGRKLTYAQAVEALSRRTG